MEQRGDIALVMLDVGGTLLDTPQNRQLPAQTGPVLGRVMERGVQVGLASGRNYAHLMSQMGHLGLNGPMVCNNGASVLYQEALLYSSTLDADALRFAFQLAKELKCLVEYSSVHDIFIYQAPGYEGPAFAAADKGDYLILLSGDAASFARVLDTPVAKITFGVDTRDLLVRHRGDGPRRQQRPRVADGLAAMPYPPGSGAGHRRRGQRRGNAPGGRSVLRHGERFRPGQGGSPVSCPQRKGKRGGYRA